MRGAPPPARSPGRARLPWSARAPGVSASGEAPGARGVAGDPAAARPLRPSRWLRSRRRLRFHRSGWALSVGAVVLGFVAIGTANNLLFLLLGGMLGFITLSGSLSELVIREVRVRRRVPHGVHAGERATVGYELENPRRHLASFAVEVGEYGGEERAFVPVVEAGASATAYAELRWERRGVYPLERVTIATSFPFGLFRKERDLDVPGEVVVWPRTDRPVREVRVASDRARWSGEVVGGAAGARGEFRGLREYRSGDDPRDVHWISTARRRAPVVRQYERDEARALWLCLDLRAAPGPAAEASIETAAAVAARAVARSEPVALETGEARVPPGSGPAQLERVLDALARAAFRPEAPPPSPPVALAQCIRVAAAASADAAWGDTLLPGADRAEVHQ